MIFILHRTAANNQRHLSHGFKNILFRDNMYVGKSGTTNIWGGAFAPPAPPLATPLLLLTLMHGAVHNYSTPLYLSDRISTYTPARTLRSESQSLAVVPRINLERYGRRAFSCAGPTLWNALPLNLRTQQDPARFRRDLKTYLFNVAYSK